MYPSSQYNYNFSLSGNVNYKMEADWFLGSINPEVGVVKRDTH